MEHGASESVKNQSQMETTIKTEVEATATSTANTGIEMDPSHMKQEPGLVQFVKSEPALLLKEEILEDSGEDGNDQQCVPGISTPAGTGSLSESCSTSLSDLLDVKNKHLELDIGPTVFQHMDIQYTINKTKTAVMGENTITDDCNEAVPGSGAKKESVEDKLRDDNDKTHKKFCRGQQKNRLHRAQHLAISSNGFNGDKTISKPQLLSVHNKLQLLNSRKISMMTVDASNQTRDETAKTKQKPDVRTKEYSSNAAKRFQHIRVHASEKPYQCDTCDARFAHKNNLVRHRRHHMGEKPYQCDTCGARFSQKGNLVQHRRVHTGEKPYQCDTCGARFSRKYHFVQHKRVHTAEKPYLCYTCDARFSSKYALVEHRRVHTEEKPYKCDSHDARFSVKRTLVQHIRIHAGEKSYQCFAHKNTLIQHRRVQTGEKPYQCEPCGARFSRKCNLVQHRRVHTDEKPYKCDTCDARFSVKRTLVQHIRVHADEKPYKCDTCDARFAVKRGLVQHIKFHTGERPYKCDTCDVRFSVKRALVQHIKVHTGESTGVLHLMQDLQKIIT